MENENLRYQRLRLGLLMGMATFSYGKEKGCHKAEALAIYDNGQELSSFPLLYDVLAITAGKLIKFYRFFGFQVVREVLDGWEDLVDRIVWGGIGTKMDARIDSVLAKWTPVVRSIDATVEHISNKLQSRD